MLLVETRFADGVMREFKLFIGSISPGVERDHLHHLLSQYVYVCGMRYYVDMVRCWRYTSCPRVLETLHLPNLGTRKTLKKL